MDLSVSGVRQPAEWEPHAAVWTAWPSHPSYWEGHIEAARRDIAGMLKELVSPEPGKPPPERVHVWVDGPEAYASAVSLLDGALVDLIDAPFGDIWFRDIAPIFVRDNDGKLQYRTFDYNGWGEKYRMENDETVAPRIAKASGFDGQAVSMVFEGGALDVDGTGLGLTTASCLLNQNRNPSLTRKDIEKVLAEQLGVDSMIWLGDGLLNDHTDGHIDNIARFVGPGKVVCQHPYGADDPNREVLGEIAKTLRAYRMPSGEPLEVIEVPSPGKVTAPSGDIVPASHMNFYIANHKVLVPCYGTASGELAVAALQALFPERKVVGLPSSGILMGGGSFHCITQQQPA